MNNNNNKPSSMSGIGDANQADQHQDAIKKLEREIWLFRQWLTALDDQHSQTQERIRKAYEDCIQVRQRELLQLKGLLSRQEPV